MENYATFKQSLALKKEGYNLPSLYAFSEQGEERNLKGTYLSYTKGEPYIDYTYFLYNNNDEDNSVVRPLQIEIVDWLRVTYNIHIYIKPYNDEETEKILYEIQIINANDDWIDISDYTYYHSPEEAYSGALDYVLEYIIKNSVYNTKGKNKNYTKQEIINAYLKGLEDAESTRLFTKEEVINKFKKEMFDE